MTSQAVKTPFIASLFIIPAVFVITVLTSGNDLAVRLANYLFAATVLVQIAVLVQAFEARKLFARVDAGHLTWSLIIAFLVVRLLVEGRLMTITFNLVTPPKQLENASPLMFFYVVVLRYVYTISDLLFVAALITTIRTYKSTGLKFELLKRDYVYMLILWVIPVVTFMFRANLGLAGMIASDNYIPAYRLTAVVVGALIASLCVAVRRYAVQMRGGLVARLWNTVVVAGTARAASFLALALLSQKWPAVARMSEQYLLWIFAGCWLLAAIYQREVLPRAGAVGGSTASLPSLSR